MNHLRRFLWTLAIACVFALLAGCGSSPAARFYLLTPTAQAPSAPATANTPSMTLSVGPFDLPAYLDRPQMARRADENRVDYAEFDRWAEPLKENFSQVLVQNLIVLLPNATIAAFPSGSTPRPDYQVTADIARFEAGPEKNATLTARVSILEGGTGKVLAQKTVRFAEPYPENKWGAVVAAQSKCLDLLSREIATALQALPGTPK